jgi:hypothetical protein
MTLEEYRRYNAFVSRSCMVGLLATWAALVAFRLVGIEALILSWPRIVLGVPIVFVLLWLVLRFLFWRDRPI